jgi:tRNA dimethylallyltransferase
MLATGLIDEVQRVRASFPRADLRRLGHGYAEMAAYLDGTSCLPDVRQDIIKQVRQYARRQFTWFRADARVQWIDQSSGPDAVLRRLGDLGAKSLETPHPDPPPHGGREFEERG